jgi:hypothetical protein
MNAASACIGLALQAQFNASLTQLADSNIELKTSTSVR